MSKRREITVYVLGWAVLLLFLILAVRCEADELEGLSKRIDALEAIVEAPAVPDPARFQIKTIDDYGAQSVHLDVDADNGPAIQAMVDAIVAGEYAGPIAIPGTAYTIKTPIHLPDAYGFRVQGFGGFTGGTTIGQHTNHRSRTGSAAVLIWKGEQAEGTAMVSYQGKGMVWDAVNLAGKPQATQGQPDPYAGREVWAGLWVQSSNESSLPVVKLGTGKVTITNSSFVDCQAGIACGDPTNPKANNADNLSVGTTRFIRCDAGLRNYSEQAVSHNWWGHVTSYGCNILWDFRRGGKFTHSGHLDANMPGIILRIGQTGSNQGLYQLGTIAVDNRFVRGNQDENGVRPPETDSRLVVTDLGSPTISIRGINFPRAYSGQFPLFELHGAARLTIRHGYRVARGCVRGTGRRVSWGSGENRRLIWQLPYVDLDRCRLLGDWSSPLNVYDTDSSFPRLWANWSSCTGWHNDPQPTGRPPYRPPTPLP